MSYRPSDRHTDSDRIVALVCELAGSVYRAPATHVALECPRSLCRCSAVSTEATPYQQSSPATEESRLASYARALAFLSVQLQHTPCSACLASAASKLIVRALLNSPNARIAGQWSTHKRDQLANQADGSARYGPHSLDSYPSREGPQR